MRLLLSRDDVNPDKLGNGGEIPLWRAAFDGYEGVVRLLLIQDDVSPNKPNESGTTPLQMASLYKHTQIVALPQSRISALSGMD